MTNSNMLYFSIGYTEDSKDPTEHINFALKKALQMPSIVRYHHRVWLPHRDGKHVVDDVWDWMSDYTHTGMCRNTIKNCGHIAIWAMTPEEDNTEKRIDKPYSRELFDKGFFAGQTRLTDHLDIVTWNRAYGACVLECVSFCTCIYHYHWPYRSLIKVFAKVFIERLWASL